MHDLKASWILGGFWILSVVPAAAQNLTMPPGSPGYPLVERLHMEYADHSRMHTAIRPWLRKDIFTLAYYDAVSAMPRLPEGDINYLLAENDEFFALPTRLTDSLTLHSGDTHMVHRPLSRKPLFGAFYKYPAHLYALDRPYFYLRVNPMLDFSIGSERGDSDLLFVNRRGIAFRGGVDGKVFFSGNIIETQLRPPTHVRNFITQTNALPDAGLFKSFRSRVLDVDDAYDFLSSSGAIGFNISRHIDAQLGHGKNFIGDGYRSLLLSDFAKNYFYLKFNTRVWLFHYQNIFAELNAREKLPGNVLVPKKYLAAHYLSLKVRPNVTVGIYEAVVIAREQNRFELQYLNPVILYRSIEHHIGSPDNILVGLNVRWDIARRHSFYGQFVLDEFKVHEFFSDGGWWGNKHGFQVGAKSFDVFGIRHLDVLLEYNQVRPFTYSHYDSLGSYAHHNQALAHPLGANFGELLIKVDYRPVERLWLSAKFFTIRTAADSEDIYFGTNILRRNIERNADFGIRQGQGIAVKQNILSLTARYMLRHNFILEAQYFHRDYNAAEALYSLNTQFISLGVRWNMFREGGEF